MFFEFFRSDLFVATITFVFAVSSLTVADSGQRRAMYWFWNCCLLLSLFVCIIASRPLGAGNDTPGYVRVFERLSGLGTATEVGASEYGNQEFIFWKVSALFKYFCDNPSIYIAFFSLCSFAFVVGCVRLVCRRYCDHEFLLYPAFCLCVYLSYCLVYFGNHLRASVAIPISILAILLRMEKRWAFALLCFVVAFGFHISVIFLLPLFVFSGYFPDGDSRRARVYAILAFVLSGVSGSLFFDVIDPNWFEFKLFGLGGKVNLYLSHDFNLNSIYETFNFWFVGVSVLCCVFLGLGRLHFVVIYFYCLVLFFAPVPKVSERFFPFALILLPVVSYLSLRQRFGVRASIVAVSTVYAFFGTLVAFTESAVYTLGLNRFF